jgi:signal recognition particle GTPase
VVLALAQQAKLPVQWVGTGETLDDLHPFNAQTYVTGLLGQANQTAESLPANA